MQLCPVEGLKLLPALSHEIVRENACYCSLHSQVNSYFYQIYQEQQAPTALQTFIEDVMR